MTPDDLIDRIKASQAALAEIDGAALPDDLYAQFAVCDRSLETFGELAEAWRHRQEAKR